MKLSLKRIISILLLAYAGLALAATAVTVILSTSSSGAGNAFDNPPANKTYQVAGALASGTGTAVISIEGSNNGTNWDVVGTTSLSLTTTTVSAGISTTDRYAFTRANVTSLSGSTPTLTVTRSY